jgi:hypothetical protein
MTRRLNDCPQKSHPDRVKTLVLRSVHQPISYSIPFADPKRVCSGIFTVRKRWAKTKE